MKKNSFILVLFLVCSYYNIAQTLTPVENENGKWGFVNNENELIVNYIYDEIEDYFEELGFAFVYKDNSCKLLDKSGYEVTENIDYCMRNLIVRWEDAFLAYGILNTGSQLFHIVPNIEVVFVEDAEGWNLKEEFFINTEQRILETGLFGICYNGNISNVEFENIKAPYLFVRDYDILGIHYCPMGVDTTGYVFAEDVINRLGLDSFIPNGAFHLGSITYNQEEMLKDIDKYLKDFFAVDTDNLIPLDLFDSENIRFVVKKNGKWGVIDENLEMLLPCDYDDIIIKSEQIVAKRNNTVFYFDYFGENIISEY